jgi:hypothetical protein
MLKAIHWLALRMSEFARWLHDRGGNLECWADEQMYRRRWRRWSKKHNLTVTWDEVPEFNPYFATGNDPEDSYSDRHIVRPRPITMLDEWEG